MGAELVVMEPQTSALALVETMSPVELFKPGTLDPLLERIQQEVRAHDSDISTEKGRKEIASLAHKVARTKTFIDGQRLMLVSDEKKRLAAIDAEGKRVRDVLDALKEAVRRPLTVWEDAEKTRITNHERVLAEMAALATVLLGTSFAACEQRIGHLESLFARPWNEFVKRAETQRAATLEALEQGKAAALQVEREREELARQRAEEEARKQRERDERIATQAREAAEAKAKRDAEQAARRAEEERLRGEREAQQREAEAKAAQLRAEREKQEAEERVRQAEEARLEAERQAALRAEQAAQRAEEQRVAAIEQERQRVAAEAREAEEAAQRRIANQKHRDGVESEACAALVAMGLTAEVARAVVTAISLQKIPHVVMEY